MKAHNLIPALLLASSLSAQWTPEYHMAFDQTADNMGLDSIYGTPGWQVGTPNKNVFDSAYSAPNALVTDTLLPYPADALSYAEFHIGVGYYGDLWDLTFAQRMDVDSGDAAGWLEYYDPVLSSWERFASNPYWGLVGTMGYDSFGGGLLTDTGVVYIASTSGWTFEWMGFSCEALFNSSESRGGIQDSTMRFRFVFTSTDNANNRAGWMIDDVHLHYVGPCTGIEEYDAIGFNAFPDPADDLVNLELDDEDYGGVTVDIMHMDGAFIRRERWSGSRFLTIQTGDMSSGLYLLVVRGPGSSSAIRLAVSH